jgi:enamine deaminase RidA (YjgF/YER057c/UK114 family)
MFREFLPRLESRPELSKAVVVRVALTLASTKEAQVGHEEINPWEWSKGFGFSQAIKLTEPREWLVCSGQTAMGPDGSLPASADMGDQVRVALDNVVAVLSAGGMSPADIVKSTIYTTDVDAIIGVLAPAAQKILGSNLPASTLIGVSRLAFPELKVEIEVVAAH